MRLTNLFTKTRKEVPADETALNAKLLIQAGFIHKEMAGVYSFLPLGLKVLNNIADIIREEMNKVGGQEIIMTALQLKERYEATGRWDDKVVDDWFKTKLVNGTEVGLGFSHEENLSPIVKEYLSSYKELPFAVYQIQTKFRNELRSKSGIMRGREFLMKDMYSYALDQKQHEEYYEKVKQAYRKVFDRVGIGDKTFLTFASGGSFARFSHEFQTLTDAGEDTIYLDTDKKIAINKEVYTDEVIKELGVDKSKLKEARAIEVGNIFSLGTKFSTPFNVVVDDDSGRSITTIMGCYGIGVSRVMGAVVELLSDENGLVWPENIAPAKVIICRIGEEPEVVKAADKLYDELQEQGIKTIYDDRDTRPGEKFADADLMGIPHRVIISTRTVKEDKLEYKRRIGKEAKMITKNELLKGLAGSK